MLPHQAALRPTGRRQAVVDLEVLDEGDGDRGGVWLVTSGTGEGGYAAELALSAGILTVSPSEAGHCTALL